MNHIMGELVCNRVVRAALQGDLIYQTCENGRKGSLLSQALLSECKKNQNKQKKKIVKKKYVTLKRSHFITSLLLCFS